VERAGPLLDCFRPGGFALVWLLGAVEGRLSLVWLCWPVSDRLKMSFEVGSGRRLKQTRGARASCQGAGQGRAERHAAASTAGSCRGPRPGAEPADGLRRRAAAAARCWGVRASPRSCHEKDNPLLSILPQLGCRLTCSWAAWSEAMVPARHGPLGHSGLRWHPTARLSGCVFPAPCSRVSMVGAPLRLLWLFPRGCWHVVGGFCRTPCYWHGAKVTVAATRTGGSPCPKPETPGPCAHPAPGGCRRSVLQLPVLPEHRQWRLGRVAGSSRRCCSAAGERADTTCAWWPGWRCHEAAVRGGSSSAEKERYFQVCKARQLPRQVQ